MIEQQLADRFRDAVAGEPPLGFDPDELIDRAIKRGRQRKVVALVAAVTVVQAAAVWAFVGVHDGGAGQLASGQPPVTQAPGERLQVLQTLSLDQPVVSADPGSRVLVTSAGIANPEDDRGTVQLKRDDQVLFEIQLQKLIDVDPPLISALRVNVSFQVDPGGPVSLTVNCQSSAHQCHAVRVLLYGMRTPRPS